MTLSRSLAFALAAVVTACSGAPDAPYVASHVAFSASPTVLAPGGTVYLTLTNRSVTAIGTNLCPNVLERWEDSTWVPVGHIAVLCGRIEHVLGPGTQLNSVMVLDSSALAGSYRVQTIIQILDDQVTAPVVSNTFTVQP